MRPRNAGNIIQSSYIISYLIHVSISCAAGILNFDPAWRSKVDLYCKFGRSILLDEEPPDLSSAGDCSWAAKWQCLEVLTDGLPLLTEQFPPREGDKISLEDPEDYKLSKRVSACAHLIIRNLAIWPSCLTTGGPTAFLPPGWCGVDWVPSHISCINQPIWAALRNLLIESVLMPESDGLPCSTWDQKLYNKVAEVLLDMETDLNQWFVGLPHTNWDACNEDTESFAEKHGFQPFCIHGYMTAAACIIRLVGVSPQTSLTKDLQEMQSDALRVIQPFLNAHLNGDRLSETRSCGAGGEMHFLDSSGWPMSYRGLMQILSEHGDFQQVVKPNGEIAELAKEMVLRVKKHSDFLRTSVPMPLWGELDEDALVSQRRDKSVSIWAFGLHRPLLEEPVTMWRMFLLRWPVRVNMIAGGDHCVFLAGNADKELSTAEECVADVRIADLMSVHLQRRRSIKDTGLAPHIKDPEAFKLAFLGLFRDDLAFAAADALLCTEPIIVCLCSEGRPVLGYVGNPLADWYTAPPYAGTILYSIHRNILTDARSTLVANSIFLAASMYRPLGARVPAVPPLGFYTKNVGAYSPAGATARSVLVSKQLTTNWDFACILSSFAKRDPRKEGHDHLSFVTLTDLPRAKRRYTDIAHYLAVVFLPYTVAQVMFMDYYALGLPIFVPNPEWLLPLYMPQGERTLHDLELLDTTFESQGEAELINKSLKVGWTVPEYNVTDPIFGHKPPQDRPPFDRSRVWSLVTEYADLPHIQHFRSVPAMLAKLEDAESLGALSIQMLVHHSLRAIEAVDLWRAALARAILPNASQWTQWEDKD